MKLQKLYVPLVFFLSTCLVATGCRSGLVKVSLTNASPQALSLIEVAYPGGTFGKNSLAAGETYNYTLKPLGDGTLKIQFTDAQGSTHQSEGPAVRKGHAASIAVRLMQNGASSSVTAAR
jgi:hypothetical protein